MCACSPALFGPCFQATACCPNTDRLLHPGCLLGCFACGARAAAPLPTCPRLSAAAGVAAAGTCSDQLGAGACRDRALRDQPPGPSAAGWGRARAEAAARPSVQAGVQGRRRRACEGNGAQGRAGEGPGGGTRRSKCRLHAVSSEHNSSASAGSPLFCPALPPRRSPPHHTSTMVRQRRGGWVRLAVGAPLDRSLSLFFPSRLRPRPRRLPLKRQRRRQVQRGGEGAGDGRQPLGTARSPPPVLPPPPPCPCCSTGGGEAQPRRPQADFQGAGRSR